MSQTERPAGELLIELHRLLAILKDLPRTGWVQRRVERPESVASHAFAVSLLSMQEASRRGLDPTRCALLALVHDLPEAIVGDRVPGELSPEEKHRREAAAIRRIDADAGGGGALVRLWEEYEAQLTPEAKLVRALDLADAVLQARWYAAQGRVAADAVQDLETNCLARVKDDELRRMLRAPQAGQGE